MKKYILLLAVAALTATSCKKNKLKKSIVGTWVSSGIYHESERQTVGQTQHWENDQVEWVDVEIEFNKDNTYHMKWDGEINYCNYDLFRKSNGDWDFKDDNTLSISNYSLRSCGSQINTILDVEWNISSLEEDKMSINYIVSYVDSNSGDKHVLKETIDFNRQ